MIRFRRLWERLVNILIWIIFVFADKPIYFKNGVSGKGKNMISKHDANLSGKKNANRVVEQVGETTKYEHITVDNYSQNCEKKQVLSNRFILDKD